MQSIPLGQGSLDPPQPGEVSLVVLGWENSCHPSLTLHLLAAELRLGYDQWMYLVHSTVTKGYLGMVVGETG